MSASKVNITKEVITHLESAPFPNEGILRQAQSGKINTLGHERSGIFKKRLEGRIFVSQTGLADDEHMYYTHEGIGRALHQYASSHYTSWRYGVPKPELFDYGCFGENLVGTNMTEENVGIGDLYLIGNEVIVQVSEPRSPCYRLNIRLE